MMNYDDYIKKIELYKKQKERLKKQIGIIDKRIVDIKIKQLKDKKSGINRKNQSGL